MFRFYQQGGLRNHKCCNDPGTEAGTGIKKTFFSRAATLYYRVGWYVGLYVRFHDFIFVNISFSLSLTFSP